MSDGGCQCGPAREYCGYTCRKKCEESAACTWSKNKCYNTADPSSGTREATCGTSAPTTPTGAPTTPTSSPTVPTFSPECFSGDSRVKLADGATKPMRELRVGDVVQVADPASLAVAYDRVVFFQHVERHVEGKFVRVRLDDGRELMATGNHIVFVAKGSDGIADVPMSRVRVGDAMLTVGDDEVVRTTARVVAVDAAVRCMGVFNPQTSTGTVVVDGVLASCYVAPARVLAADVVPQMHYAKHATMAPMLVLAKMAQVVRGSDVAAELPENGLHPYLKLLAGTRRVLVTSAADAVVAAGARVARATAQVAAGRRAVEAA